MSITPDATLKLLDILDTAVKIGLGAIIAAVGAVLLERIRRRYELDKETMRRRCDALENLSDKFERQFGLLLFWYESALENNPTVDETPDATAERKAKMEKAWDELHDAVPLLHEMSGRLLLLGLERCAAAVVDYSARVGAFVSAMKGFGRDDDYKQWKVVVAAKEKVYGELSAAYLRQKVAKYKKPVGRAPSITP